MPTLTPRKDNWLRKLDEIRAHIAAHPSDDYAQVKSRALALRLAEAVLPEVAEMSDHGISPGHVAAIAGAALGPFLANLSLEIGADNPAATMVDLAVRAQIGANSCFKAGPDVRAAQADHGAPTTAAAQ
jgi:hypothetical protein